MDVSQPVDPFARVRAAALNQNPVSGLTHRFYRYPARFSPVFAAACIEAYSMPGQVVLDPYMGGGTTVVEAFVRGRVALGSDINALSVFVADAKTTLLTASDRSALIEWVDRVVAPMRCNAPRTESILSREPRNLHLPQARWLRKLISLCLDSLQSHLPTAQAKIFARCVLLNVGQWALNGRKRHTSAAEFRHRVAGAIREMLMGEAELSEAIDARGGSIRRPILRLNDADRIDLDEAILANGPADLVVTSPPYPGVHMLYHRWQVDGRKETDAPYWITDCNDGCGAAYYNFAGRRGNSEERYFEKAEHTFSAVRRVMRHGAVLAQLVAFGHPERQLHRYLLAMEKAGFREMPQVDRIWRNVPGRRWHATTKGDLPSAREVVLLHLAD